MIQIVPSLASASQIELKDEIDRLKTINNLHLDIEDGNFVPNITFGLKTVHAVASYSNKILDAHLMVINPMLYIDDLLALGVKKIAIHAECSQYPAQYLSRIRAAGGTAGLAFNCMAPVESALYYEKMLDYVLLMTAEPDGHGQKFNPAVLNKIRMARRLLPDNISIMVDGGIGEMLLGQVLEAGADTVVMGRAIWDAPDPFLKYHEMMQNCSGV